MEKTCKRCQVIKPLGDFYVYNKRNSYQNNCKICDSLIKYKKIACICGKLYTYTHKKRHLQSNYHLKKSIVKNNM